jgi:hypothetical protein
MGRVPVSGRARSPRVPPRLGRDGQFRQAILMVMSEIRRRWGQLRRRGAAASSSTPCVLDRAEQGDGQARPLPGVRVRGGQAQRGGDDTLSRLAEPERGPRCLGRCAAQSSGSYLGDWRCVATVRHPDRSETSRLGGGEKSCPAGARAVSDLHEWWGWCVARALLLWFILAVGKGTWGCVVMLGRHLSACCEPCAMMRRVGGTASGFRFFSVNEAHLD